MLLNVFKNNTFKTMGLSINKHFVNLKGPVYVIVKGYVK